MKHDKSVILSLILVLLFSVSTFANGNVIDIPKGDFSNPHILAQLTLVMEDGSRQTYNIFQSPFVDDERQIYSSIEFVYEQQSNVKEILLINGVPLKNTKYSAFSGTVDRRKIRTGESDYAKGQNHDMVERNPDAGKINTPQAPTRTAKVEIDGKLINSDVDAFVQNGRAMVPLRAIGEALDTEFGYHFINEELKVVWMIRYDTKIDLNIGDHRIFKDGRFLFMDQPPILKEGRTFVPVRYIAELFDCKVEWDESISTVKISTRK